MNFQEVVGQDHYQVDLEKQTVPQFMCTIYEHITSKHKILAEIGIVNLIDTQLDCLIYLPLINSANCLLLFANWVNEGIYEFSNVPLTLKVHMSCPDRIAVEENLKQNWIGGIGDLLTEIEQLIDVLKHFGDITRKTNENLSLIHI